MQETVYDTNVPIYLQLIEKIQRMIVTGEWRAGERIPAVRELALAFGVNPNTMQRALAELERDGLLYSERTSGRFVTEDQAHILRLRDSLAGAVLREFLSRMEGLGCKRKRSCPCCGGTGRNRRPQRNQREKRGRIMSKLVELRGSANAMTPGRFCRIFI